MSTTYFIELGSGIPGFQTKIKYAWRVAGDTLSGSKIRSALGIKKAKDNEPGLVFGANFPKPAKVRVNFEKGGSTTTFCDPSKLEQILVKGALKGKTWDVRGKFFNKKISSVTAIQG